MENGVPQMAVHPARRRHATRLYRTVILGSATFGIATYAATADMAQNGARARKQRRRAEAAGRPNLGHVPRWDWLTVISGVCWMASLVLGCWLFIAILGQVG